MSAEEMLTERERRIAEEAWAHGYASARSDAYFSRAFAPEKNPYLQESGADRG